MSWADGPTIVNLFGDPILEMKDFFWALPIPEGENIFQNLFGYEIDFHGWNEKEKT